MSATPLVIWLPEPIATASLACFSAGTSLTPSPIIAVKRPLSASARDQLLLLIRSDPAEDRVALGGVGEPAVVGRQLWALDHADALRDADCVGDRGHGLARVAGDQLQVDLLAAHVGDRLGGVGAQRLLEHDQRPRLEPRRRLGRGIRSAGHRAPRRTRRPGGRPRCARRAPAGGPRVARARRRP